MDRYLSPGLFGEKRLSHYCQRNIYRFSTRFVRKTSHDVCLAGCWELLLALLHSLIIRASLA